MRKFLYSLVLLAFLLLPAFPAYAQGTPGNGRIVIGQDFTLKSGETLNVGFPAVGHRADHRVSSILALQHRGHAPGGSFKEKVQQERLEDVVRVVPKRDFAASFLHRNIIENPSPQAGA